MIYHEHHWIVLHRNLLGFYELFDSLGDKSNAFCEVQTHFKSKANLTCNENPLQSDKSSSCGEFVIFYIYHRYWDDDIPFNEFIQSNFTNSLETNEVKVKKFVEDLKNGRRL